jgi:uncharacterized protein with von Willebrand factor type A (vWA) domain
MDRRMVEFVRALRAAGVRISVAESQDALFGIEKVGIFNPEIFRTALKTTLVKERHDQGTFDYFFPLFFSANQPPMEDINEELTPEQQQMIQQALDALMGDMEALRQLLEQLLNGQRFSDEQLQQMGQQAGLDSGSDMYQRAWFERRMNSQAGLNQLNQMIDQLLEMLAELGFSQAQLNQLEQMLRQNLRGLSDQISQYAGATLAQQMGQREPDPKPDLMDVPFQRLTDSDIEALRDQMRQLAARLRSRNALRQKRARTGDFDPRRTLRSNMRYGGVPIRLQHRNQHKKPSLVLICDLSTSMRYMVEFFLTLVYQLQDQVKRTHSFIFISDLVDITMDLEEHDSRVAVEKVMRENPPGYYSTDLGNSLATFNRDHMSLIDSRTTVIILGDGRNNHNDPRLDIAADMQRKARRLFWFCPEPPPQWGTGDSDMHLYAPLSDGVMLVRNLRELANSIDRMMADS